jgi:hypothetical protein
MPDAPADRVAARLAETRDNYDGEFGDPHVLALLAAVEAALALHRPFRIYEPCDHDHDQDDIDAGRATETADFVSCDEMYLYSICASCCRVNLGQSETCADAHEPSSCWPCETYEAVTRALLGEQP